MDDQRSRISDILHPVMDAAVGLASDFDTPEDALKAVRQVEVAVELATDLLMQAHLARAWPSRRGGVKSITLRESALLLGARFARFRSV
ncbi:hypothetical protein ACIBEJ_34125 [Nonomuraea sp. NPDC050790]|uniref:hypothetical protein n=1 Tax=Nonomuraea sp. NPDC050790 TaxID=3364371 RepID=UPI0037A75868